MADNFIRPVFVGLDGQMTDDGRKLVAWIEAQFVEADKSPERITEINALSGDIKHYYVNVYKMNKATGGSGGLTPEKWLNDYRNSISLSAWRNMQFMTEQAEAKQELITTSERTKTLEENMQKLQETLADKVKELTEANTALKEELDALKSRRGKKKAEQEDDGESEE
jgi:hypothetical protein